MRCPTYVSRAVTQYRRVFVYEALPRAHSGLLLLKVHRAPLGHIWCCRGCTSHYWGFFNFNQDRPNGDYSLSNTPLFNKASFSSSLCPSRYACSACIHCPPRLERQHVCVVNNQTMIQECHKSEHTTPPPVYCCVAYIVSSASSRRTR